MIRMKMLKNQTAVAVLLLLIGILAGCAAKKGFNYGSADTGYFLSYRPQAAPLTYNTNQDQVQTVEAMGQTIETKTNSTANITVTFKGMKEDNLSLGITVNDMGIEANNSMQGDITADVSEVIGKSFEIVLSPLGKEVEIIGADDIKIDMGAGGKRSIKQGFSTFFPDLNDKPLKPGDSWNSQEVMNVNESGMKLTLTFNNVNTMTGIETADGVECLKVEVKTKGTMEGSGQQMGADMAIEGDMEGTGTWYFAYKDGYFVKAVNDNFTEGTVAISGAQNMTLPMTIETKSEVNLVK